jgi:glycolate oxidase FAD binding subunit
LVLRLSGAKAAIAAAQQTIGGEEIDGDDFWLAIREQSNEFFTQSSVLWRLSVPSTAPPIALGEQLIEWGGAQRWLRSDASVADIRAAAVKAGGHATLFRGGDKSVGVFQPLAPAVGKIHQNMKNAFDPDGIFNPGRMYAPY